MIEGYGQIQLQIIEIIAQIKRDSDCNGNDKDNSEKQLGWGGGRGRLYTYRYTVTTRMTPALRWAAMMMMMM